MNGSARGGLVFAGRYIAVILMAFSAIVLLIYALAWSTFGSNDVVTLSSLIVTILPASIPFVLLTAIAFLAGYCPEGTRDRLIIRFLMDAFKIFCIFYVTHSVEHTISMAVIDSDFETHLRDVVIGLDVTAIAFILTILPIMSMADNVIEYVQNKGVADDTGQ